MGEAPRNSQEKPQTALGVRRQPRRPRSHQSGGPLITCSCAIFPPLCLSSALPLPTHPRAPPSRTIPEHVSSRSNPKVLLSALIATLLIVLIDLSGGFDGWNEQVLDLEQRHLPRDVNAMSSDIVMVDIDDRALERIGRWPWPRTAIAGAIDELLRAGARTIAVDLDLADPQLPTWHPGPPATEIDHDGTLAEAITDRIVLGTLLMPDELASRWAAAGGDRKTLPAILEAMNADFTLDPRLESTGLSQQDRDAAADTMHMLWRHVIFNAAANDLSRQELLERAGPQADAMAPIIDSALRQHAARVVLPGGKPGGPSRPPSPADRFPIDQLVKQAGATGYINIVRRGHDGGIRQLVPTQSVGHEMQIPGLGIAAVLTHLGEGTSFTTGPTSVRVGDVLLPLHDEAITVCWPRGAHGLGWPDLHRATTDAPRFTGHLSIGELVLLAQARITLQHAQADLVAATRSVLSTIREDATLSLPDWLDADVQAEVADEVDFTLENIATREQLHAATAGLDADTIQRMGSMLDWRNATTTLAKDAGRVTAVEESLRSQVEDRLVFIGWTATGTLADFVPTAAGPRTPGVMVHAAIADMVLQDRSLWEGARWWSSVAAACLGLLIALLVATLGPWPATASASCVFLLWCVAVVMFFWKANVVLPLACPLVTITLSWATGTSSRAIMVQREKRRVTLQFRARVPEALVDELARDPDSVGMRGVRREVCVMFGDLAGFTTISEQLDTEDTVALLNQCMSGLAERVTDQEGYVNKFLGDGFLAFWSAFGDQPNQADLAGRAAIECQKFMREINANAAPGTPPLGLRIGIATGEALVGDCGAPPRLNDYTVIGDVANLSARLESANKQFGSCILIDGRTKELIQSDDLPLCEIGPIQVVGRDTVVDLWMITMDSVAEEIRSTASKLAAAIRSGDRAEAQDALAALEAADGPSKRTSLIGKVVNNDTTPMPRTIQLREK